MEDATGESSAIRLFDMQDGFGQPTRADDAIRFATLANQIVKRARRRCALSIDVCNQISQWGKFQSFDERSAFVNGCGQIQKADEWILGCNFLDDTKGVVLATVEYHDELEFSAIHLLKVAAIVTQDGLDPVLLVIGRNQ